MSNNLTMKGLSLDYNVVPKVSFKLIDNATVHKAFYLSCEIISKIAKEGWCARPGLRGDHNRLFFTAEQMTTAFNLAGVEIK